MTHPVNFIDVEALHHNFTYLFFLRVDRMANIHRWYYLGWQSTLFHTGAVVRRYGRIGGQQQNMPPLPFDSLDEAWPTLRAIIRTRLRNGYRIASELAQVEPIIRITFTGEASEIVELEQLTFDDVEPQP